MKEPSGKPLRYFTPDEVSDILGPAIRLEQVRSEGLSVIELEQAASEVGISRSALHQAIEQYRSLPGTPHGAIAHLPRLVMHGALGGAVISLLIGWLAPMVASVRPVETAPLSAFLAIMLSGGLAGIRSRGGAKLGFLEFQARNLGVLLGLTGMRATAPEHGCSAGRKLFPPANEEWRTTAGPSASCTVPQYGGGGRRRGESLRRAPASYRAQDGPISAP